MLRFDWPMSSPHMIRTFGLFDLLVLAIIALPVLAIARMPVAVAFPSRDETTHMADKLAPMLNVRRKPDASSIGLWSHASRHKRPVWRRACPVCLALAGARGGHP